MVLVQILKRRDASSVIVAVVGAMVIAATLQALTQHLAATISGVSTDSGIIEQASLKDNYIFPIVWMLLNFIAFELLARLVIFVFAQTKTKK